jgi:hypothetical protein
MAIYNIKYYFNEETHNCSTNKKLARCHIANSSCFFNQQELHGDSQSKEREKSLDVSNGSEASCSNVEILQSCDGRDGEMTLMDCLVLKDPKDLKRRIWSSR